MRLLKKSMAMALVAAMVVTLAPADSADAAKKVKLDKKKKTVEVGKTVKVKVKNAKKSAKVTWKSSKKKVAKIKKSTKKGNATATVLGVKKGKSVISATVKTGKKKVTLKCTVTVKAASVETPTAAPTATATVAPGTATPVATATVAPGTATPVPTPKATRTPKPSPTPSPTPMPVPDVPFAEVTNGIPIDVSTFAVSAGNGGYNEATGCVEINDQAATDCSQGAWALPAEIPAISLGDEVTFRVQGYNYGTSGFRFWIGTGTSGACTPILLDDEIDESLAVGDYPCVVTDEAGNSLTMNQKKLEVNEHNQFDVTFTFKAGESQNDTDGVFSHFTLKYIMGGDTSGYIDGLCIKNIYYITDDASLLPTPTPDPDATPTPAPDFTAMKVAEPFTVDGVAEEAWDAIEAIDFTSRIVCDNAGDSTTAATAKLAWDANNLYGLVTVLDENIDATAANNYQRDGVEFFLDEDNDAVATWEANTDAFQYRFTGLTKDAETEEKLAALTSEFAGGSDAAKAAYAGVEAEYTFVEGGYIVEFKIPFATEKAAGARVGFDAIVQDCKDGLRDAEWYLGATEATKSYWNLADTFKVLELVEPYVEPEVEPGTIEDLGAVEWGVKGTAEKTVNEDGSVTFANESGFEGVFIPLDKALAAGEKVQAKVEYEAAGTSTTARLYLINESVDSNTATGQVAATADTVQGELEAASASNMIFVKVASHGLNFTSLKIKKVVITYPEAE